MAQLFDPRKRDRNLIGRHVSVPATYWGEKWARKQYKGGWNEAKVQGNVKSFMKASPKVGDLDLWRCYFPRDRSHELFNEWQVLKWLDSEPDEMDDIVLRVEQLDEELGYALPEDAAQKATAKSVEDAIIEAELADLAGWVVKDAEGWKEADWQQEGIRLVEHAWHEVNCVDLAGNTTNNTINNSSYGLIVLGRFISCRMAVRAQIIGKASDMSGHMATQNSARCTPPASVNTKTIIRPAHGCESLRIAEVVNRAYRPCRFDGAIGWTHESHIVDGLRTSEMGVQRIFTDALGTLLVAARVVDDSSGGVDDIVGCVKVGVVPAGDNDHHQHADASISGAGVEIGMLAVLPGLQASGVGSALLASAEDFIRQHAPRQQAFIRALACRSDLLASPFRVYLMRPSHISCRAGLTKLVSSWCCDVCMCLSFVDAADMMLQPGINAGAINLQANERMPSRLSKVVLIMKDCL
eukprot:jgi/Mesvir1/2315/Mv19346-RA.1